MWTLEEYMQIIYCLSVYDLPSVISVRKADNRILIEDKMKS